MHPDDQRLLDAIRRGAAGGHSVIDSWLKLAAGPYRSRLGDDWEDALQDVRLELWRLLEGDSYRAESRLKRYVFRVVNHSMIDRLRRSARRAPLWQQLDEEHGEEVPDQSVNDAETQTVERSLLLEVLAQVPEECRRLWRALVAGAGYEEMSRQFGARPGTLRVRVLRCRRRADQIRARLESRETRVSPSPPGHAESALSSPAELETGAP